MILTESEAKRLLEKVLSYSKADSVSLSLSGSNNYNLRFALNSISTNGYDDSLSLAITSNIGQKSGSLNTNIFGDDELKEAVLKSEEIAKHSPDNKEFIEPPSRQDYLTAVNYSESTERINSNERAKKLEYITSESDKRNLKAAGYFENSSGFTSILNSRGLFAYNKNTHSEFSTTVRTKDGTGSSRTEKHFVDINNLDTNKLAEIALTKSELSRNPQSIDAGKYTVILEPAAVSDMTSLCLNFMGARGADEGRSYFSKKSGGNKIGESLINQMTTIYSDPTDLNAPSIPFTGDGQARNKVVWFENGILKNLHRNRFWAKKMNSEPVPYPSNIIMSGSSKTTEQLISESDYAILVTRFWYIRTVDQQSMLLTGLTRDGVFEIVNGKINRPIKNFRFNESPINIFNNILDMSRSEKATGSENSNIQTYVPALKVKNFNFSSISDAI